MLNKHGRVLIAILVVVLVLLLIWLLPSGASSAPLRWKAEPTQWDRQHLITGDHVTEYIRDYLVKGCDKRRTKSGRAACKGLMERRKRWKRADPLGQMIDEIADSFDLDPLVLAVVVRRESSFYEQPRLEGKLGEQGLTQVHGYALRMARAAGYDMRTSEGQLKAGALHLVHCREECDGTLYQTLSKYQSGHCRTRAGGPRYRTKEILRNRTKFSPRLVARSPFAVSNI